MLEVLDLTLKLEKAEYRERMTQLRSELRDLQHAVRGAGIPVVVLFEGWDASGKGDSIGSLVYPLDPRGFKVYTTKAPNEEEQFRPFLWRFWTRLPGRGDFVFLDRSWYRRMLEDRMDGQIDQEGLVKVASAVRDFERQLTDDGFVLIKFWLHISKKEQKRRLASMGADRYERWRLALRDWKKHYRYKRYAAAAEEMFAMTSTASAPWQLVQANDRLFRRVKVFETVTALLKHAILARGIELNAITAVGTGRARTDEPIDNERRDRAVHVSINPSPSILDRVDLSKRLDRKEYEQKLNPLQERLRELELECYRQRLGVVVVYEGWDAAGKGGNIKRLTQELDPRGYEVIPVGAPDVTERAHHYLWRFWKQLPKAGHIALFDRSWYGRVLVERVEGFATEAEWRRAYQEIDEFERQLGDSGMVIVKFWLHLSPEEQLRRFREREKAPHKRYKITAEDWRNRAKWNEYRLAVAEMIECTSTNYALWTIVEAEDKLWARVKTLDTLIVALEERLKL